jgi:ABC-type glycerol-3-phosphate transport system permease component
MNFDNPWGFLEDKPQVDRDLRKKNINSLVCGSILTPVVLIFITPLLWLSDVAFRPKAEIFQVPPRIFQAPPWETIKTYSLDSFGLAIDRYQVNSGFYNSVLITTATIIFTLLVCSLAAYAFGALRFPGRNTIFFGVLATMMLPTVTMIAPYYRVLRAYGLINNRWGLIIPYTGCAFGVFLLRQYIVKLPKSFFEAAIIDGASRFRVWWQIILPLTKPGLSALAIYQFQLVWNDFLTPMIVLRDNNLFTLPIKLQFMDSVNIAKDYDAMVATGLIAILIPVIFFIIFQRQFIEGISGGVNE